MASSFPGAIDSFTDPLSGSALNSPSHSAQHADLNDAVEKVEAYMGLVKVIPTSATNGTVGATGTVTIGSAVSSVTVNGAFSSLYNNYQIITSGGAASTSAQFFLTLGGTATGYYSAGAYCTYAGAVSSSSQSNAAYFMCSSVDSQSLALNVTLQNPFTAFKTLFVSNYFGLQTGDGGLVKTGFLNNTTSYTSFTLTLGAGTMTGGSITVYGYRI